MTLLDAINASGMTPARLQSCATLTRRRLVALALNLMVYGALCGWLASILGAGGWSYIDIAFFACFLVASPWAVLGFVNATLGLWLACFVADGVAQTAPFLAAGETRAAITERIAIVMTVRNEDVGPAIDRLAAMETELSATADGAHFSWHLLSDTSDPAIAADEERLIGAWRAQRPGSAGLIHYRRRCDNSGFKAGNLRAFCADMHTDYDLMIVLDADSFMRSGTLLQMVRIAGAHPRIGILQSLAVGAPSRSAFTRLFQFGMRMGMRSYTLGASWWTGDCGPFWGHNALVRVRPFLDYCALPKLSSGPILSHDQIEAALMRRAGLEVRVMPVESGSYEQNPPDLMEFSRRDLRWCRGNMQYWRLLGLPGLAPVSRFQLVWAIAMFIGLPASQALLALAALKPFDGEPSSAFPAGSGIAFLIAYMLLGLTPKLAGLLDAAFSGEFPRYGGARLFALGAALEFVASYLLSAAIGFRTAAFLLGLPFGRSVAWGAQRRSAVAVSWSDAARDFWPATLFGVTLAGLLCAGAPAAVPYALPFIAGLALAIPFAKLTASPALGAFFVRYRLCAAPEELASTQDPVSAP